jgi:hypothetical protein
MGSHWLRLWLSLTGCCFILWLCAGCSDANVARHSGEYRLNVDATEGHSPGSRELFNNVVLTLKSDRSFSLNGKFAGVSRTDRGKWSIAAHTITLSFTRVGDREERFSKVAAIDGDRLTFEIHVRQSDVTGVFLKHTYPTWVISIFAVVMLVVVWLMYAHRESPNVSFAGGSPKFVTAVVTIFS